MKFLISSLSVLMSLIALGSEPPPNCFDLIEGLAETKGRLATEQVDLAKLYNVTRYRVDIVPGHSNPPGLGDYFGSSSGPATEPQTFRYSETKQERYTSGRKFLDFIQQPSNLQNVHIVKFDKSFSLTRYVGDEEGRTRRLSVELEAEKETKSMLIVSGKKYFYAKLVNPEKNQFESTQVTGEVASELIRRATFAEEWNGRLKTTSLDAISMTIPAKTRKELTAHLAKGKSSPVELNGSHFQWVKNIQPRTLNPAPLPKAEFSLSGAPDPLGVALVTGGAAWLLWMLFGG